MNIREIIDLYNNKDKYKSGILDTITYTITFNGLRFYIDIIDRYEYSYLLLYDRKHHIHNMFEFQISRYIEIFNHFNIVGEDIGNLIRPILFNNKSEYNLIKKLLLSISDIKHIISERYDLI